MKIIPQKDKILSITKDELFIKILTLLTEIHSLDLNDTEIKQILTLIKGEEISKRSSTILSKKNFLTDNKPNEQFFKLYEKLKDSITIELNYNVE